jgi:hypothetical protein
MEVQAARRMAMDACWRADVIPACDGSSMNRCLRGIELRYVLTMHLSLHGPATIADMVDALSRHGFCVSGRSSKAISDALRWEIGRGRVHRIGPGRYVASSIPRATEYRIHQRVLALREMARLRADTQLLSRLDSL